MNNITTINFSQVRQNAYLEWLSGTDRSTTLLSTVTGEIIIDDFENGFECRWQSKARTITADPDYHVPHFCSLGDWAGNVTDILTDPRYDTIPMIMVEPYNETLFRFYTRFMLVLSEMLTDFQDLLLEAFNDNQSAARNKLSAGVIGVIDVNDLFDYINSVCKHKVLQHGRLTTKLHQCNHHLPFYFEDSGQPCTFINPLKVGNLVSNPDGIIVPKLEHLVRVILSGYNALDQSIKADTAKFHAFVKNNGISMP